MCASIHITKAINCPYTRCCYTNIKFKVLKIRPGIRSGKGRPYFLVQNVEFRNTETLLSEDSLHCKELVFSVPCALKWRLQTMDKAWKFLSCTIRAYFPYTWNRGRDKEVSNFATSIYQTLNWVAIGTKPGARSLCKTGLSKFVKLNALIDIIGLA